MEHYQIYGHIMPYSKMSTNKTICTMYIIAICDFNIIKVSNDVAVDNWVNYLVSLANE